jgi:hypothetical protein
MTASAHPPESPQAGRPDRALVRLWLGVLLPPVVWAIDFMIRTLAVRFVNVHQRRWPLHASTVFALTGIAVGAWLCARARREMRRPPGPELAIWGLALAAFFLLLILTQAFPTFIFGPREIT